MELPAVTVLASKNVTQAQQGLGWFWQQNSEGRYGMLCDWRKNNVPTNAENSYTKYDDKRVDGEKNIPMNFKLMLSVDFRLPLVPSALVGKQAFQVYWIYSNIRR